MTRILMVASEATPFCKTGGLADVMGALPPALRARGEQVAVVLPAYRQNHYASGWREVYRDLVITVGKASYTVDLLEAAHNGVPYYFVHCPALFDRDGLYGTGGEDYPDNAVRFGVFSRAALSVIRYLFRPDVVHCHDWQAALTPVYMRTLLASDPTFLALRVLFTIHNLGYQGIFPAAAMADLGLDPKLFQPAQLEFFGRLNLMLGAIHYSDAVSTVSRGYAREIQTRELGFGLDEVLRARAASLYGIVNGADYEEWSPDRDSYLARHFEADSLEGKRDCKRALLQEFGLPLDNLDRPLIGIVSRFVNQKGFDLIAEIAPELLNEDLALVALGTGDPEFEKLFLHLAAAHPGRFAVRIGYDNALAHRIEAGADMFLMPSRYEPCGLNQIYSLRYGTIPIVRATGGLDDTVDETTGFKFQPYTGPALLAAIRAAIAAWKEPLEWRERMRRAMAKDYSWTASAAEYSALYRNLLDANAI